MLEYLMRNPGRIISKTSILGLGLSFVQASVQAHGGKVRVKSELNKGSNFVVKLPRVV